MAINFTTSIKSLLSFIKTQLNTKQDAIMTKGVYATGNTATISNDLTYIPATTISANSNIIDLQPIADSLQSSQSRVISVVITSTLESDITPTFQNAGTITLLCEDIVIPSNKLTVFTILVDKDTSSTVSTVINKASQP